MPWIQMYISSSTLFEFERYTLASTFASDQSYRLTAHRCHDRWNNIWTRLTLFWALKFTFFRSFRPFWSHKYLNRNLLLLHKTSEDLWKDRKIQLGPFHSVTVSLFWAFFLSFYSLLTFSTGGGLEMATPKRIYHVVQNTHWSKAQKTGEEYFPPTYDAGMSIESDLRSSNRWRTRTLVAPYNKKHINRWIYSCYTWS